MLIEGVSDVASILCLIPRTTVTSLSAPKEKCCKMHPLSVNTGILFYTCEITIWNTRWCHGRSHGGTKYRWLFRNIIALLKFSYFINRTIWWVTVKSCLLYLHAMSIKLLLFNQLYSNVFIKHFCISMTDYLQHDGKIHGDFCIIYLDNPWCHHPLLLTSVHYV